MQHAPIVAQSCLRNVFPRPSVILHLTFLQPWRSLKSTLTPRTTRDISSYSAPRRRGGEPSQWTISCWSRPRTYYHQIRQYTSKPDEYGSLSERAFQAHAQKFEDLSLHDVRRIFGPSMMKKKGNEILSRLQKRRITGTLDHEAEAPTADIATVEQALEWLRKTYPLDEDAAMARRVEREVNENEKEYIQEIERLKNWHPQQSAGVDGVYGKPMVDEFAKIWNARQAAKQKKREDQRREFQERKAKWLLEREAKRHAEQIAQAEQLGDGSDGPESGITAAGSRAVSTGGGETSEWIKRYKEKGRLSDMLEPPKMSKRQRLLPLYALAAVVIAFCGFFATHYQAPLAAARVFPDWPVSVTTLGTITALNLVVFLLWRLPPMWRFLNKNFLHIVAQPLGRTLLTAPFSHQQFSHLFSNMFGLWLLGLPLHEEIGRGAFLAIFFVSSISGGLIAMTRYVLLNQLNVTILGASGAVCGIWAAWAWLPSRRGSEGQTDSFKSLGSWFGRPDLDDNATWFWRLLLVMVIAGEFSLSRTAILKRDHWGHIGGYLSGIACAEGLLWQARNREPENKQRQVSENGRLPASMNLGKANPIESTSKI